MILYNITYNIDKEISAKWIDWMKNEHIPMVMKSGGFIDSKMLKLLNDDPEAAGETYALQFFCHDFLSLEKYLNEFSESINQRHLTKWANKFVAFSTFLEEV